MEQIGVSQRPFVDFYLVLGIAPSATPREIGAAYRSLARKHHPDSSETQDDSTDDFKAVAEAYETLSDPQRRRAYDRRRTWDVSQTQRPRRRSSLHSTHSLRGLASFLQPSGSSDEPTVCDVRPQVEKVGKLGIAADLPIAPEEARAGARVVLTLTVSRRCDGCKGKGCSSCGGRGSVQERRTLRVQLPLGVTDGTMLRLPRENVVLCVRIRPYW
jgi:DnaJ-class molecular chaperone